MRASSGNARANRVRDADLPVHRWYRFVLSFPPHLVREVLERFGIRPGQIVLDPFCGTGTTLVECKRLGLDGVGVEAHPMAHLACRAKTDWRPEPAALVAEAQAIARAATDTLAEDGVEDAPAPGLAPAARAELRALPPERAALLLKRSISPRPLHKALVLLEHLDGLGIAAHRRHLRLAFAHAVVHQASNLRFGPEVGLGKIRIDL